MTMEEKNKQANKSKQPLDSPLTRQVEEELFDRMLKRPLPDEQAKFLMKRAILIRCAGMGVLMSKHFSDTTIRGRISNAIRRSKNTDRESNSRSSVKSLEEISDDICWQVDDGLDVCRAADPFVAAALQDLSLSISFTHTGQQLWGVLTLEVLMAFWLLQHGHSFNQFHHTLEAVVRMYMTGVQTVRILGLENRYIEARRDEREQYSFTASHRTEEMYAIVQ